MRAIPAGALTEKVGEYVAEKTGITLQPGMFQAFCVVDDDNEFQAGIIISNFRKTDCEISVAGETAMAFRPHCMKAVFTYIFVQLGCVRCTCITTKRNRKARAFIEGAGFVLEGNLRLGYDGKHDALVYGLLAKECRFLEGYAGHGEEIRTSAASGTRSSGDGGGTDADEQGLCDSAGEPKPYRPVHAAG